MSGHSKWSQIKRAKKDTDQKRGLLFSKLAHGIMVAVKLGGGITDPTINFRLRLVIDKAKQANMPKENINRAIKRALGSSEMALMEMTFEAFAPGGVAVVIKATSSNRARSVQAIKNILDRYGGHLAAKGSVTHLFNQVGMLTVNKGDFSLEEILSIVIDSGVLDIEEADNLVEVYTKPDKLHQIRERLIKAKLVVGDAELVLRPMTFISIADSQTANKILGLMQKLEELEDVDKVYANFDIPNTLLSKLLTPEVKPS